MITYYPWTIVRTIGAGSFGTVYEIERKELAYVYRAALKVISIPSSDDEIRSMRSTGLDDTSISEYFSSEASEIAHEIGIMNRLKGTTNIVSLEDHQLVPHEDGIGYDILIRMELLTSLDKHIAEKGFSKDDVIRLGIDLCTALERCRKVGIIHRDIKPANIFVSELGDFKLGDFGIARIAEKTQAGMSRKGTMNYMAPEVYFGYEYNHTVDIYSLGVVMYQLLNHNRVLFLPPYPDKITYTDFENAMTRRLRGETPPPPDEADSALAAVILKACSANPGQRYYEAAEMRRDLEDILKKAQLAYTYNETLSHSVDETVDISPVQLHTDSGSMPDTASENMMKAAQPEETIHVSADSEGIAVLQKTEEKSGYEETIPISEFSGSSRKYQKSIQPEYINKALVDSEYSDPDVTNENTRRTDVYNIAVSAMKSENSESAYKSAAAAFRTISGFEDANEKTAAYQRKIREFKEKEEAIRLERERHAEEVHAAVEKAARKRKRTIAIAASIIIAAIAFVVLLTTVILPRRKSKALVTKYGQEFIDAFYALNVGDVYKFGSYEQDNNTADGTEDIEWLVLAKEDDRILVISKYALDCQQYNTSYTNVTWKTCSLRKWLNGTFLNSAFSEDERAMIPSVAVSADKNSNYGTDSGNGTIDQVFLLSITEVTRYFSNDSSRQCQGTAYCYAQGAYQAGNDYCRWWLRSPGSNSYYAASVDNIGSVNQEGNYVDNGGNAVRPAMWIDLGS